MTKRITKTAIEIIAESIKTISDYYDECDPRKDRTEYISGVLRGKKIAIQDLSENIATGLEVLNGLTFDRKKFLELCGTKSK